MPLPLRDMVQAALASHPAIAAARARARAAGADLSAARGARLPTVGVEGQVLDNRGGQPIAQVVVDQPLWSGGRISATIERARAQREAALAGLEETRQNLALSVSDAWFEQYRWRARERLLADSYARHNDMVASMQRRVDAGVSPLADLELARSRALQIEQQRLVAAAQASTALRRLRELVGDPGLAPVENVAMPANWPIVDEELAIGRVATTDPRLRRVTLEAAQSAAEARMTRASIWPQLSGQYSYNDVSGHRFGLVLKAQSDGGLSRFATANAARLREEAGTFQIAAAQRDLNESVANDVQNFIAGRQRLDASGAAAETSDRVMQSYMRQFASGRRSWLDVMNAVREATSADIDALDARVGTYAALVRLQIRMGDLTFAEN